MKEHVKRFARLFNGLQRAYGTYDLTKSKSRGSKVLGQAITKMEPLTEDVWLSHLSGVQGVGVVPIRDDSSCFFGAIDIDIYDGLDVNKVINTSEELDLPLVFCRSKSGGLHAFCFVKDAVPAATMREKLSLFSAALGHGGVEIFPKQSEILAERGDVGGWINMPYFDAARTTRYAMNEKGEQLSLSDFLKFAEARRKTKAEFEAFTVVLLSDISDGPPCLQHLITKGFSSGSRNDGLFNLAVYLKKANPDQWPSLVDDYNVKYMDPPLSSDEVQSIVKSLQRKEYTFTCDRPPIKSFCNQTLCRTRKYGLDPVAGLPTLTGLTKYDTNPPIWFIDIEGGGRLELTTDDIQNQARFQRRCMDSLNIMPPMIGKNKWNVIVQGLLESVTIIEAPTDASPEGQFTEHLEQFCTGKAAARVKDEILLGKPWTDEGRHFFRLRDLLTYLERQRFRDLATNKITSLLKEMGGEHHFYNLKGKGINCWSVPEFKAQSESFDTPEIHGDSAI